MIAVPASAGVHRASSAAGARGRVAAEPPGSPSRSRPGRSTPAHAGLANHLVATAIPVVPSAAIHDAARLVQPASAALHAGNAGRHAPRHCRRGDFLGDALVGPPSPWLLLVSVYGLHGHPRYRVLATTLRAAHPSHVSIRAARPYASVARHFAPLCARSNSSGSKSRCGFSRMAQLGWPTVARIVKGGGRSS
jgi:hypothetical protein